MTKNTFFRGLALILLAICALCPIKASAEINYSGLLGDVNKDKAIDISDVSTWTEMKEVLKSALDTALEAN